VARSNRCNYGSEYAKLDLERAGFERTDIEAIVDGRAPARSGMNQEALDFARKLTEAADTVTDDEVARLVHSFGDRQVVAMVLLIAYANFQDRLLMALGINGESSDPLPPLGVRFTRAQSEKALTVPERKGPAAFQPSNPRSNTLATIDDPDWRAIDFASLQKELDAQRDRPGRVRVPAWEEVRDLLPQRTRQNDPLRIKWSLVCIGYQPELALGWSACTRAFGEEAKQDRVFEESLFWVITRTIHCFY
jgi:hypothetical protein